MSDGPCCFDIAASGRVRGRDAPCNPCRWPDKVSAYPPSPVTVSVPLDALARLCRLAREAGEDLQDVARQTYPSDNPSSVRRRNNEIAAAQELIDAATALSGKGTT